MTTLSRCCVVIVYLSCFSLGSHTLTLTVRLFLLQASLCLRAQILRGHMNIELDHGYVVFGLKNFRMLYRIMDASDIRYVNHMYIHRGTCTDNILNCVGLTHAHPKKICIWTTLAARRHCYLRSQLQNRSASLVCSPL